MLYHNTAFIPKLNIHLGCDNIIIFFDKHLKGKSSSLLDGEVVYEEAEFEKRIPVGMGY
jgi:hypothetical protein